jgi:hypothetical protein
LDCGGYVTRLDYKAGVTVKGAVFYKFEVYCCHTPLEGLTASFAANYGGNTPVLVLVANPYPAWVRADQWFSVVFTQPFPYNNRDNLLVEVRWHNQICTPSLLNWAFDGGRNRMVEAEQYNGRTGTTTSYCNHLRVYFSGVGVAPASWGKIKAVLR